VVSSLQLFFYGEELLAPAPSPKKEDPYYNSNKLNEKVSLLLPL
jgi:hypothetical protein